MTIAQSEIGVQGQLIPAYLTELRTPEKYLVAGVGVSAVGHEEALSLLLQAPRKGARLRVHFAAMHTFVEASRNPALRQALNDADIVAADGMPIVWLGRQRGLPVERFCGPDAMPEVLDLAREQGYSHFFYGGTPQAVQSLTEGLQERFPGLRVAGSYSPPFRDLSGEEKEDVVRMINESGADYVWVGLGSPKQDLWLAELRPRLDAAALLAVGAAFDFHSGRTQRAPKWAQNRGLEWLFRLAAEPRRLAWRYTATAMRFGGLVLLSSLRQAEVKS